MAPINLSSKRIACFAATGATAVLYQQLLPALERFRYEIYVVEQAKNLPQVDHELGRLPDVHDASATHFVLVNDANDIAGCVRLHMSPAVPEEPRRVLELDRFLSGYASDYGYVSKLMVRKSARGSFIALHLMEAMVDFARTNHVGAEVCFFHCHPRLIRLYEGFGFQRFGLPFEDQHVGSQVPMYFLPGDMEHFRHIGSPLARIAARQPISSQHKTILQSLLHLKESTNE